MEECLLEILHREFQHKNSIKHMKRMVLLVLLRTDPDVSHQWHSGKPMRGWQHSFRHGHSERGAVGTV